MMHISSTPGFFILDSFSFLLAREDFFAEPEGKNNKRGDYFETDRPQLASTRIRE